MTIPDPGDVLQMAHEQALEWFASLGERHARPAVDPRGVAERLGRTVLHDGQPAVDVIAHILEVVPEGLSALPGGRFFGWVMGGAMPVGVAADWLAAAWDQNVGGYDAAPTASLVEQVTGDWVKELLGLPATASTAFVTGGMMANFTCLAAARDAVLRRIGWDVEADGLQSAPRVRVIVGGQVHSTVSKSLRLLGLGERTAQVVPTDAEGRMDASSLVALLAQSSEPTIVCAQAGEVNSGAFDDLTAIGPACKDAGAWLHVDGAFGLWAAATPSLTHLTDGLAVADSWSTDAHKTLSTPYDCGIAIVADPAAHKRALGVAAAYLPPDQELFQRTPMDWGPELSRRFRALPVYAVLRHLGRTGIASLVEQLCGHARTFAAELGAADGVEVLNEVAFNQVLVRFTPAGGGDADAHTRAVLDRVAADGTCFMSATEWFGQSAMRISVSSYATDEEDVRRSVAAVLSAHRS